jgi:hypothetical protein
MEITPVETFPATLLVNESRRLEVNEEIEENCVFLTTEDQFHLIERNYLGYEIERPFEQT